MNIIKGPDCKPEVPPNWWHGLRCQCRLCGTIYELTSESPIEHGSNEPYQDFVSIHFHCPSCKKRTCRIESKLKHLKPLKIEPKIIQAEVIESEPQPPGGFFRRLLSL
jgi:rubredoxin